MPRPSFQFYPADWRANANLRRCSHAARGAWMDILSVLHDSAEYGVCRWPLSDLATAAGIPLRLATELANKQVLKGADANAEPYVYAPFHAGKHGDPVTLVTPNDGPCWYSSRLVRDEWIRKRRGASTRFGEENPPPKATPKPGPIPPIGDGLGYGPSSSSSSSSSVAKATAAEAAPQTPKLVHSVPDKPTDDKAALYAEMREVCGKDSGGLATQLLDLCGGNLLKARGLVFDARGRPDPRAWIMGAIRKRAKPGTDTWGLEGMV